MKEYCDLLCPQNLKELEDFMISKLDIDEGEGLCDDTCVEGNSGTTFEEIKDICLATDFNVYFEDIEKASHLDTYYLRLDDLHISGSRSCDFRFRDEVDLVHIKGSPFIRFWAD